MDQRIATHHHTLESYARQRRHQETTSTSASVAASTSTSVAASVAATYAPTSTSTSTSTSASALTSASEEHAVRVWWRFDLSSDHRDCIVSFRDFGHV